MDIRVASVKDILWELASVMLNSDDGLSNNNRYGGEGDIDSEDDAMQEQGEQRRRTQVSDALVDRLFRMLRPAQQV